MDDFIDELRGLAPGIKKGLTALRQRLTPKRIIITLCIAAVLCAGCGWYSLARFGEINFVRVLCGAASLDSENYFREINDNKYLLLNRPGALEGLLDTMGEVEIGNGGVKPYDDLLINGRGAWLEIDPVGEKYCLVEVKWR